VLRVNEIAGFQCLGTPPSAFTAHSQDHAGSGASGVFKRIGAVLGACAGLGYASLDAFADALAEGIGQLRLG
jgi:predicted methyltransferase